MPAVLLPIEVMPGSTIPGNALDGMRWWTGLPGNDADSGVPVFGSDEVWWLGRLRMLLDPVSSQRIDSASGRL